MHLWMLARGVLKVCDFGFRKEFTELFSDQKLESEILQPFQFHCIFDVCCCCFLSIGVSAVSML